MLHSVSGDLTTLSGDFIIVQQVNCQNVMGAGLAKSLMTRWPQIASDYHTYCAGKSDIELLGHVQTTGLGEHQFVCNVFGQRFYGRHGHFTNEAKLLSAVKITKGYAYAFQLLGKLLFDRQPISENTVKEIERPYFEKLASDSYIKILEELTENEKRYLINVNNGLKAKEIAELWQTSVPNVSQYKRILIKKGIISQNSAYGKVDFELPLFDEYLNAVCDPENLFYAGFDKNTGKLAEY